MQINRGDIYWIQGTSPKESHLSVHPHPYVVLQDNVFNHSRITTVVACALSTNLKDANAYGNVLLEAGEANLPKQSMVVVSKVVSAEKSTLGDYIGTLSPQRVDQIIAGIKFQQASYFER